MRNIMENNGKQLFPHNIYWNFRNGDFCEAKLSDWVTYSSLRKGQTPGSLGWELSECAELIKW